MVWGSTCRIHFLCALDEWRFNRWKLGIISLFCARQKVKNKIKNAARPAERFIMMLHHTNG